MLKRVLSFYALFLGSIAVLHFGTKAMMHYVGEWTAWITVALVVAFIWIGIHYSGREP